MEKGRVCTGFSHPVVGKYVSGDASYTNGMVLARGVEVKLNIKTGESKVFHADNGPAESANGRFSGGTVLLVVDGLNPDTEKFVLGLPEPVAVTYGSSQTVNVTKYGDEQNAPYVGIGYVVRYVSGGVDIYVPTILRKAKFKPFNTAAKTQEDEIDYQTQEIEADLMRSDTESHEWKWIGEDQTTEDAAIKIVEGILGVTGAGA